MKNVPRFTADAAVYQSTGCYSTAPSGTSDLGVFTGRVGLAADPLFGGLAGDVSPRASRPRCVQCPPGRFSCQCERNCRCCEANAQCLEVGGFCFCSTSGPAA
jgi:hypothetical protein